MLVGVHVVAFVEPDDGEFSADRFVGMVRQADEYGFDRVTTGGSGAGGRLERFVALTVMAMSTKRAQIGPMVVIAPRIDVAYAAAALASLDTLTNGRAFYVLGRGDGGVHSVGMRPATVAELREYFLTLKSLVRTGHADYQGRHAVMEWPYSLDRVPLYLVAEGPIMLRLAGEIADGVYIGAGLLPEVVKDNVERVRAGAIAAGRNPDEIDIWWETRCAVGETREEALQHVRRAVCHAGNHALRGDYEAKLIPQELIEPVRQFHKRYDTRRHGPVIVPQGGDHKPPFSNMDLMDELGLTDYFLERFGVVGTPDEVVARLKTLQKLGINKVNLNVWNPKGMQLLGEEVLPRL